MVPGLVGLYTRTQHTRVLLDCTLLVGVHGGGLTNAIWLPDHAVVMHIIPYGVAETGWADSVSDFVSNFNPTLSVVNIDLTTSDSAVFKEVCM
jgi:hypothetical protein